MRDRVDLILGRRKLDLQPGVRRDVERALDLCNGEIGSLIPSRHPCGKLSRK